ncbi:hypothetical protein Anapl_09628 [Anas platyrhynchos]|uniref:Uncharacterized protein n=1 Tax=Anas platyrhynchos TaxID=8839 RepID=R0JJN2_ANAPL|nr:hypothetical protein Anapl_09628 [Anas platyrhynchos]
MRQCAGAVQKAADWLGKRGVSKRLCSSFQAVRVCCQHNPPRFRTEDHFTFLTTQFPLIITTLVWYFHKGLNALVIKEPPSNLSARTRRPMVMISVYYPAALNLAHRRDEHSQLPGQWSARTKPASSGLPSITQLINHTLNELVATPLPSRWMSPPGWRYVSFRIAANSEKSSGQLERQEGEHAKARGASSTAPALRETESRVICDIYDTVQSSKIDSGMDLAHDINDCSMLLISPAGNINFWTNEKADGFHVMLYTEQIKFLMVAGKVLNP